MDAYEKPPHSLFKPVLEPLRLAGLTILFWVLFFPVTAVRSSPSHKPVVWPSISFKEIASGFQAPVYITHAGDSSGRLFVVEQIGRILILQNDTTLPTPFLDIQDRVQFTGEEGLLSVAFPPDFDQKGYFYVVYTRKGETNNQVSRFYLSNDPNVALASSEEPILFLNHPNQTNHNGGLLKFGPDGYLYIGTGDGGGGGDPYHNAQNPGSLLGKLLRIDSEYAWRMPAQAINGLYLPVMFNSGLATPRTPYQIPADNPYANQAGAQAEVWALGLRNPWRYSFDRQSGDLYIADVGQGEWEEVDFQPAGSPGGVNYGWNVLEGDHCYPPGSNCQPPANYSPPVTEYNHGTNDSIGCAITGGYVYRGSQYPQLQGTYFYGDYCTARVWGLQNNAGQWQSQELKSAPGNLTSFGEDQAGELYLTLGNGRILQLTSP